MTLPDTTRGSDFAERFRWLRSEEGLDHIGRHYAMCLLAYVCVFFLALVILGDLANSFPVVVPHALVLPVAVWLGIEAVLARLGLFGRRWQPLLWLWLLLSMTLAVYVGGINLVVGLQTLTGTAKPGAVTGSGERFAALIVTLPPIVAAVVFAAIASRPGLWASFRRFQLMLLAAATLAGSLPTGLLLIWVPPLLSGVWAMPIIYGLPLLMPVIGALVLLVAIGVVALVAVALIFVFVTLPLMIYDLIERGAQRGQVRAHKRAGLEQYLLRFSTYLRNAPLAPAPDDSRGARFALPREIDDRRQAGGFAFGHLGARPLFLDTDKHVLLMASTRSGKGVSVIIPHLLRHPGSAFVLDPKGENARATGRYRERINGAVHYLDPFGISGKPLSRFNPLASFTAENMEAGSKALASALVMNEKRDHWTASGQQLVAAVILHVVTSPSFAPAERDLVTMRRLLLGAIKPTLEEMRTNEAAGGLIADLAASFLATPEKEFGSIVSTAQRETEILDNPYIAACVGAGGSEPEVDFSDWHRGTMSVFLCLSAPKFPVFNRWLRLVLTAALDAMTDRLAPPPVPVCFMLDELATLGHLGVIENAVGLSAGYGIQLVAVFQDIAQMKDLYKGRWASFIGNAGVRALFNLDDYDTAKYWSDFLGGRLVDTHSESQDIYGLTKGQGRGEALRPLLSPEQIMLRYAAERMLVLPQGMRPIEAERVPYWLDGSLNGAWDDPRHGAT